MQLIRLRPLWACLLALFALFALAACGGGSSAPPPAGGITVVPGDGQATVSWTADPGVEYWLFFAPGTSISTKDLTKLPNHMDIMNVTSPYVVTGLSNGVTYAFTVNGRVDGGPGGTSAPSVAVTPRPAGGEWKAAAGLSGTADIKALAYGTLSDGNLRYLAAGSGGALWSSADGATWSAITGGPATDWTDAVYILGQFFVVGSCGSVLSSPDLVNWTTVNASTPARLNAIASNGVQLVAVGDEGMVRVSTDGLAWTSVAAPTSAALYSVIYASSGRWMAVGANGTLLTSTDAITWTASSVPVNTALRDIATQYTTSGYSYRIVGDGGTVLASSDASTWTVQTLGSGEHLHSVVASSTQWAAVGDAGSVWLSTDGSTWTAPASTATSKPLYRLLQSQGQYLAAGQGATLVYSR